MRFCNACTRWLFQDLKSESAFFPLKAKKLSQFLLITSNAYHHAMAHFPGDHMAQVVWIYQLWGGSYTNFFTPIDRKVGENHKKLCWGLDNFFTFSISYISKKLRFDALNFLVYTVKWLNCGINAQYLDQSVGTTRSMGYKERVYKEHSLISRKKLGTVPS